MRLVSHYLSQKSRWVLLWAFLPRDSSEDFKHFALSTCHSPEKAKMSKSLMRAERRKSHPLWWDSHISPKSSKWMADNTEEMDRSVQRMLKLIEGEGDSFAKKADMYYQKRPELVFLVEDFHRMYRSLAERYNHLTGELRKTIPSDLNSQSSGISEAVSEQITPISTSDRRSIQRRTTHRAAGFDFFLGSAGGSCNDLTLKDVEHSSLSSLDSDLDSDDASSTNNYSGPPVNGNGERLHRRVIELEIELRDAKERLHEGEGNRDGGNAKTTDNNENYEKLLHKFVGYQEQLRITNEKLKLAEEEITRLKRELGDGESMKIARNSQAQLELVQKDIKVVETGNKSGEGRSFDMQVQIPGLETSVPALDSGSSIEILKTANRRLQDKEDEIARLKFEFENDKRSLEEGTSDTGLEVEVLREEISKISQNSSAEKERLEVEISKVTEERAPLEAKLRDCESKGRSLEEEMERLKAGITQRGDDVEALNKDLDVLKLKYEMLVAERDGLKATVETMMAEVSCRDDRMEQMEEHLKRLHMEQMEMLAGAERGRKVVEELGGKVRELEEEVERQRVTISNGAEEKREAIRQLCFSLDHYRNGYKQLRQVYIGNHKRHSVLAS
ncbi:protein NETWORKED 4A-like [Telopea speciosissima]|uniref:protein NETWORKED 4A-like n=1 Tax=Telopea speciosissima TaxID=54955 RepID=UPI001CC34170|nr:protein NETWORKED 4A-like [Telopea speciosissima]